MKFQTQIEETIFVANVTPEQSFMFNNDLKTGLSVIWNTKGTARIMIDNELMLIEENQAIFITEYHQIDKFRFECMNVIQFNRPFYCIDEGDAETGCKGLLFFSASKIPKISIPTEKKRQFEVLWEILVMEMEEKDDLKLEMLRVLLKRFLILFLRIYKIENSHLPADSGDGRLIREYNFLVEKNYKIFTKVSDIAKLLHKSPKTLANVFKKYISKTPLQIINDRRLLEAKRLLKYTDASIQEISDMLNFRDVQSFSHFFKVRIGLPPSAYRDTLT